MSQINVAQMLFFFIRTLHYIDRDGKEHFHTVKSHPPALEKKKTLLAYFTDYMNEHLLKVNTWLTLNFEYLLYIKSLNRDLNCKNTSLASHYCYRFDCYHMSTCKRHSCILHLSRFDPFARTETTFEIEEPSNPRPDISWSWTIHTISKTASKNILRKSRNPLHKTFPLHAGRYISSLNGSAYVLFLY